MRKREVEESASSFLSRKGVWKGELRDIREIGTGYYSSDKQCSWEMGWGSIERRGVERKRD